jgi:hypothetical protein
MLQVREHELRIGLQARLIDLALHLRPTEKAGASTLLRTHNPTANNTVVHESVQLSLAVAFRTTRSNHSCTQLHNLFLLLLLGHNSLLINMMQDDLDDEDSPRLEINKLEYFEENTPDFTNFKNVEHDKLIKKYTSIYKDCFADRKIVQRLNSVLRK